MLCFLFSSFYLLPSQQATERRELGGWVSEQHAAIRFTIAHETFFSSLLKNRTNKPTRNDKTNVYDRFSFFPFFYWRGGKPAAATLTEMRPCSRFYSVILL